MFTCQITSRNLFSSFETEFNYDYHVTMDEDVAPPEYNYKNKQETVAQELSKGEMPGLSVFFACPEEEVPHNRQ